MGGVQEAVLLVLAGGAMGKLIDFYVGKAGQKRINAVLIDWWVLIAEANVKTFSSIESRLAYKLLKGWFGLFLSWKRLRSMLLMLPLAIFIWIILLLTTSPPPEITPSIPLRSNNDLDAYLTCVFMLVFSSVSISFTIWLARIGSIYLAHNSYVNLLVYFIVVLVQVLVTFYGVETVAASVDLWEYYVSVRNGDDWSFSHASVLFLRSVTDTAGISMVLPLVQYGIDGLLIYIFSFLFFFSGIARLSIGLVFLLSFTFRAFHKAIVLTLERLLESGLPIFTCMFSVIAVVVKAVQYLCK